MPNFCTLLADFDHKYDGEVGITGHHIAKRLENAKRSGDQAKIAEYEDDLRIAINIHRLSTHCHDSHKLKITECRELAEGIDSWSHELEYWTSKWYIKPFVKSHDLAESRAYVQQLRLAYQLVCPRN